MSLLRLKFLAAPLLLCCTLAANAQTVAASVTPAAKPEYESDPRYISAMTEARQMIARREYEFARSAYVKANKIAGGACVKCMDQLGQLLEGMHEWKAALANADEMQALAVTPREKSMAEGRKGQILIEQAGDKPKPAQLEAAHTVLQQALTDFPKNNGARWSDACVLARLGKNDDAKQQFAMCAQMAAASDPMRARAEHFAENPGLSLHKMAPAFEVKTADGSHFNLDNMTGRVVLIDFWATWCGPCMEELPHLQKIAKEFSGEPLVIISVSWDSDETKWRDFIAKHEMTWVQFRDADHKLTERFGVPSIPHYFTIDSDGVLTGAMLGSDDDVSGKLKKLIKRAKASRPPAATASEQVAGTQ